MDIATVESVQRVDGNKFRVIAPQGQSLSISQFANLVEQAGAMGFDARINNGQFVTTSNEIAHKAASLMH